MGNKELFITELRKMRTEKNGPIIEGIEKAFIACANDAKRQSDESIAVLESARGGADKVEFFRSLASAVLECGADDRSAALRGLDAYREYLLGK